MMEFGVNEGGLNVEPMLSNEGMQSPIDFGFNFSDTHFNFSIDVFMDILNMNKNKRQGIDPTFEPFLIFIYIILMISGMISNLTLLMAVVRRAQLRTPRNLFIINLTLSDVLLCCITMPFTLIMLIQQNWDLGIILCKLVPVIQGMNIFVCSGTVLAICLDRYFTIVHSKGGAGDKKRVHLTIIFIWILAFLLTVPILMFQDIEEVKFGDVLLYNFCMEKFPSATFRALYTIGVMIIQLAIPILVLAVVHTAISRHLNSHSFARAKNNLTGIKNKSQSIVESDMNTCVTHLLNNGNGGDESGGESRKCSPTGGESNGRSFPKTIQANITPNNKITLSPIDIKIQLVNNEEEERRVNDGERRDEENELEDDKDQGFNNEDQTNSMGKSLNPPTATVHHLRKDSVKRLRATKAELSERRGTDTSLVMTPNEPEGPSIPMMDKRTKKELERNRKTTILLTMVTLVFAISWIPLHVFTLIVDLQPDLIPNVLNILSITHIIAMSTAITNAVLYGWFNTNLRRSIIEMLSGWCHSSCNNNNNI